MILYKLSETEAHDVYSVREAPESWRVAWRRKSEAGAAVKPLVAAEWPGRKDITFSCQSCMAGDVNHPHTVWIVEILLPKGDTSCQ